MYFSEAHLQPDMATTAVDNRKKRELGREKLLQQRTQEVGLACQVLRGEKRAAVARRKGNGMPWQFYAVCPGCLANVASTRHGPLHALPPRGHPRVHTSALAPGGAVLAPRSAEVRGGAPAAWPRGP